MRDRLGLTEAGIPAGPPAPDGESCLTNDTPRDLGSADRGTRVGRGLAGGNDLRVQPGRVTWRLEFHSELGALVLLDVEASGA